MCSLLELWEHSFCKECIINTTMCMQKHVTMSRITYKLKQAYGSSLKNPTPSLLLYQKLNAVSRCFFFFLFWSESCQHMNCQLFINFFHFKISLQTAIFSNTSFLNRQIVPALSAYFRCSVSFGTYANTIIYIRLCGKDQ